MLFIAWIAGWDDYVLTWNYLGASSCGLFVIQEDRGGVRLAGLKG
jgi:hypothetical protein